MRLSAPLLGVLAGLGIGWCQDPSGMAMGVLQQTRLAQQAIVSQQPDAALVHVRQARALTAELRKTAPIGHEPLLVPVSREIETTTTYRPVKRGKDTEIANRLKKDSSIREVEGEVITDRLDVTRAAMDLEKAEAALQHADWVAAASALDAVGTRVVHTQTQGEMPLLRARQNLELARSRMMAGKVKDAAAPLRAAALAMADFEKMGMAVRAEELEAMRADMELCARDVSHGHGAPVEQGSAWLDRVNAWQRQFFGM